MPLTLDENTAQYQIKSYVPGRIKINDTTYTHSLILTSELLIPSWDIKTPTDLRAGIFAPIFKLKPTILLLGTGPNHELIDPSVYGELINARIGVEVMSTSAAARTFNALASENRQVAAALIV